MTTGMMALRNRCEEKEKSIRYDGICCMTSKYIKSLENWLDKNKVNYWYWQGSLYTKDKRFNELLRDWLNE